MHRADFLKNLLASMAIGKLPVELTKNFRKIYLLQCFVAGFRFYEGMKHLQQMKAGDLLELVREPQNPHDQCAIALHWHKIKIGFIPADLNEMLSHLLDAEALSLFGIITHLEQNAKPWENVAVAVYFVQEAVKDLPAHAGHLTRIEAPHYRTLSKGHKEPEQDMDAYHDMFETTNRVINLDTIPPNHQAAKAYYKKHYGKYKIDIEGGHNYVHIKDDGIYDYLYDISCEVQTVRDKNGKEYYEFFLG